MLSNFFNFLTNALIILTTLFIIITLKSLYNKRKIFKFASTIKGYRFYPIVGNGHHLINKDLFSGIKGISDTFGMPCNMWIGHDYYYITSDAQEIKILLNHPCSIEKGEIYQFFKHFFGSSSLFLLPAEPWKKARKMFSKSFSQQILNSFVETFDKKSKTLCDILKDNNEDKMEIFQRFTIDSVLATVFSIDYKVQETKQVRLAEVFSQIQDVAFEAIYSLILMPIPELWYCTHSGRTFKKLNTECETILLKVLKEKREEHKQNNGYIENKNMLPLLDAMLECKEFSDKDIFEEALLFMGAATDTSGANLVFFFTMLGMNPEIQEKVYNEIIETVGNEGEILYTDLANLKYLERVMYESMRLFPVTPLIARKATKDINIGTRILPKDSNVFISIFDLQRNETYYENPKEFNPNRFSPEEIQKREQFGYTFIPFSGGPRNCIGKTYALMLLKVAAANIIRKYKAVSSHKSIDEIEICSLITARPKNGKTDFYFISRE